MQINDTCDFTENENITNRMSDIFKALEISFERSKRADELRKRDKKQGRQGQLTPPHFDVCEAQHEFRAKKTQVLQAGVESLSRLQACRVRREFSH